MNNKPDAYDMDGKLILIGDRVVFVESYTYKLSTGIVRSISETGKSARIANKDGHHNKLVRNLIIMIHERS